MKQSIFKTLLLSASLFGCTQQTAQAQEAIKTVSLTVTGSGKTIEQAKTNALRSAIEQAFGTFISSKTEIFNDNLVKDEIVSVSNGNIQKFEVISEVQMPNSDYAVVLKAIVSISKLVTYCKSKGITVEYEGGLFAQNMDLILLNEKNELVAWQNTKKVIDELMKRSFEYTINSSPPTLVNNTKYQIGIEIDISMNKNYQLATDILLKFCESITLSEKGVQEYVKVAKPFYPVIFPLKQISTWTFLSFQQEKTIIKPSFKLKDFVFRNRLVANEILHLPWDFAKSAVYGFKLSNGLDNLSMSEYTTKGKVLVYMAPYMKPDVFRGYIWKIPNDNIWGLFGRTRYGYEKGCEGVLGENDFFEEDFFPDQNQDGYGYRYDSNELIENLPVLNFIGISQFLHLQITDQRDIEEIRKIKELKININ